MNVSSEKYTIRVINNLRVQRAVHQFSKLLILNNIKTYVCFSLENLFYFLFN